MARPPLIEFANAFYHVMSRGLNRQNLFLKEVDFKIFLYIINQAKIKYNLVCHSYCLMNNHYHLFLQTPQANLSLIMKFINESYARYFLKEYPKRDGHVFKGRYKRKIVQTDLYSLQLMRYIHLNPVKANLVLHPHEWKWSSYGSYIGTQFKNKFLETGWLSKQFSANNKKAKELIAKHCYEGIECDWDPEDYTVAKLVLGSQQFFQEIASTHLVLDDLSDDNLAFSEYQMDQRYEPDFVKAFIKDLPCDIKLKEKLLIYCLRQYTNLSLREVGGVVGKKAKTVSMSYQRTKKELQHSALLRMLINIG